MGWNTPMDVTDSMIDEASPGYWDEPEEACEHEEYESDILIGRATCTCCGHAWWQSSTEIEAENKRIRDYGAWQRRQESWWFQTIDRLRALPGHLAYRLRRQWCVRQQEIDDEIPF